ncbi:hypothetical protein MASR2M15_11520 [Anaerolineales bacterium]
MQQKSDAVFPLPQINNTSLKLQFIQKIGEGALGEVWEVEQNEQVQAIKFLKYTEAASIDKHRLARLQNEIYILEQLRLIDHIPHIYGYDLKADPPYYLMELIKGDSWRHLIHSGKGQDLSLSQRLGMLIEIATVLRTLHINGILHRDVKPDNIRGIEEPYLLDFSIAVDLRIPPTETNLVGTALYTSPYQETLSPTIDTFSLGIVAYELLFGRHPFYELEQLDKHSIDKASDLISRIHQNEWALPSQLASHDTAVSLINSDLHRLDIIFKVIFGPPVTRFADPVQFIEELKDSFIESNIQLNYKRGHVSATNEQLSDSLHYTPLEVERDFLQTQHEYKKVSKKFIVASIFIIFSLVAIILFILNQ